MHNVTINNLLPGSFGTQLCTFICSEQASYLVGQNILLDGGAYPWTFR